MSVGSDDGGWSTRIADHQNTSRKRTSTAASTSSAGVTNTPFVNAAMAAEGTSLVTNLGTAGMGYINGDLTVALARLPLDDWIGVQGDSHWVPTVSPLARQPCSTRGRIRIGLVTAVANPAAQIDFRASPFEGRNQLRVVRPSPSVAALVRRALLRPLPSGFAVLAAVRSSGADAHRCAGHSHFRLRPVQTVCCSSAPDIGVCT